MELICPFHYLNKTQLRPERIPAYCAHSYCRYLRQQLPVQRHSQPDRSRMQLHRPREFI